MTQGENQQEISKYQKFEQLVRVRAEHRSRKRLEELRKALRKAFVDFKRPGDPVTLYINDKYTAAGVALFTYVASWEPGKANKSPHWIWESDSDRVRRELFDSLSEVEAAMNAAAKIFPPDDGEGPECKEENTQ